LCDFLNGLIEAQKINWSELISQLLQQWDARHQGLTSARKREMLEHVLNASSSNPETLYGRLQNLLKSWGEGLSGEFTATNINVTTGEQNASEGLDAALKNLLAFTLETVIAGQLAHEPRLAAEAHRLAAEVAQIHGNEGIEHCLVSSSVLPSSWNCWQRTTRSSARACCNCCNYSSPTSTNWSLTIAGCMGRSKSSAKSLTNPCRSVTWTMPGDA